MSREFTPEKIRQVLGLELGDNDSGEPTVRRYLLRLLGDVWREGEGFNGKRPFGNSSWEYDLYVPMVRAGLVGGRLDSDGCLDQVDDKAADALIHAAIAALDAPHEDAFAAWQDAFPAWQDAFAAWQDTFAGEPGPAEQAAPCDPEPKRYALVEQMGRRSTVGAVRETTFAGASMIQLTDLRTGSVHLVSPQSVYEITWLTEDEARARARPWTAVAISAGNPNPWGDLDDEPAAGPADSMEAADDEFTETGL